MENLILEDNLKGSQMGIGHISEHSAVSHLIRSNDIEGTHSDLLNKTENALDKHKSEHSSAEDAKDRDYHGKLMATAINQHIKDTYPGYKVSEVHHTNYGSISDVTKGKHNDSRQENPSDIVVGLKHPTTGETIYHGYSLKSTQKKGGKIGFKNPTPKTMDKYFGTSRHEMHQNAMNELLERHPHLKSMPNKSKTKRSRKDEIAENPDIKKSVEEISKKHFHAIAKHTAEHLNNHLESDPNGHKNLKEFLKKHYMNTTSGMPYAKVTASGTKGKGYDTHLEDVQNSKVTRLLNHPDSKMRVNHSGGIVKYEIHDPETNQWHGVANEQVKTSSGFGYSSGRHNIHPPHR